MNHTKRFSQFAKSTLPTALGAAVLIFVLLASVTMQTFAAQATPTPIPAQPATATTVAAATAATAAPGVTPITVPTLAGTPGDKMMEAYFKAKELLGKKIGKKIGVVKNWTFEIVAFTDDGLGCAPAGTVVKPGFNGGYSFVYTLFDNSQYEVHTNVDASKIYICPTVGGATAGGKPGVAPVPGKISGGFEIGGQVQDFSLGTVGKMNQARMKWVKFQFAPGNGGANGAISAGHTQGFKVLISLKGDRSQVLQPGYFDQYASAAAGLATAGADAIEVWNEQNLDREWPNGQIDPNSYTQLLSKAFNAIHTANPSTIVISGALAPTGAAGPGGKTAAYWNDDVYYQGMAAAGAGNYADCIGVHYNEGVVSPTQTSGDPRDSYPTRYFTTMLARAIGPFAGKPACFTEIGFLTPEGYPPLPAGFTWGQNTTIAQQAQYLAQAAVAASASGRVRLMIVFNVDFSYYGADPQAGYAIIRIGGTCPACDSLAAVAQ